MKKPKFITIVLHKDSCYSINTSPKDIRFKPIGIKYKDLFNMKLDVTKKEYEYILKILEKHKNQKV